MQYTNASPKKGLTQLSVSERMLGRFMQIEIDDDVLAVDTASRDLAADLFWLYYKSDPQVDQKPPVERKLNAKLIEWVTSGAGWTSGKASTVANLATSAFAAGLLHTTLSNDAIWKELLDKQAELERKKEQLESLKSALDSLGDEDEAESDPSGDDDNDGEEKESDDLNDGTDEDESDDEDDAESDPSGEDNGDGEEKESDYLNDRADEDESDDEDDDDADSDNKSDQAPDPAERDIDDETAPIHDDELDDDDPSDADRAEMERELQDQIEQLEQETAELEQDFQDGLDELEGNEFAQAIADEAAHEAGKQAQSISEEMAGWGMGMGSDERCDPTSAMDFIKKHDPEIREIAKLAGRFRGIAINARRSRVGYGAVPTDARMIRNIQNLFPTERALLRHDAPAMARAVKVAQWADGGLLGWNLTGNAKEQGPFVAAVDVSGSMEGKPNTVAKAVALGVAQAAKSEGRQYQLFTFSTRHEGSAWVESGADFSTHLAWAEKFGGGGTDFNYALVQLMSRMDKLGRQAKGVDALFISDGDAFVSPEIAEQWKKYCERDGARLFYVEIGGSAWSRERENSVWNLADLKAQVSQLDETVGDQICAQAATWMR